MAEQGIRDFVRYTFYKVAPEWRRLSSGDRERDKAEFANVVAEFADRIGMASYTLVGTRGDVDFMLWQVSPTLEALTELAAQLNHTGLGKFLSMPHSYLAMTRRSPYVDPPIVPPSEGGTIGGSHRHPGQEGTSTTMRITGRKYLFVYPFVKTHDWYQLLREDRQRMMNQHFVIGHRYPTVKISTAYSFGLDDQEFVLGFETDEPDTFLELVMELREAEVRPYTLRDTPIFTCISKPLRACLDDLG